MEVLLNTKREHWQNRILNTECAAINLLTYGCLPSFSQTSLLGYMGKEITPIYWHIHVGCAIFMALSLGWKIKFLGLFLACNELFGQILIEH